VGAVDAGYGKTRLAAAPVLADAAPTGVDRSEIRGIPGVNGNLAKTPPEIYLIAKTKFLRDWATALTN